MPVYSVNVEAITNTTINTEDSFVEITNPAGGGTVAKRIRISCDTPGSDAKIAARIVRKSVAGAGGAAFTPVKKRSFFRASGVTANVKSGATGFTVGTVTDVVDQVAFNARAVYEWVPKTADEEITNPVSGIWGVLVEASVVSLGVKVTVELED